MAFSALMLLVGQQKGHAAIVSCFSKIQIGFTFLVLAHPGSPRQRALNGCVCLMIFFLHKYYQYDTTILQCNFQKQLYNFL